MNQRVLPTNGSHGAGHSMILRQGYSDNAPDPILIRKNICTMNSLIYAIDKSGAMLDWIKFE
jgi:hypothetical protein